MNAGIEPVLSDSDFWKNPQNWIYIGVAVIVVIGAAVILLNYSRSKTEAEIKAEVLESLRQSEPPQISAEDRERVLQSLRASKPPTVSAEDKAKVLESLRAAAQ